MSATISSIGIYHPEKEILNSYFESILNTTDTWIRERTGIERRFYARDDEYTSDMCVKAAQNLAHNYDKDLSDVDFIIAATSTGDQIMPCVASQVQTQLQIPNAGCFDLASACAGFVYGVIIAKGLIAAGTHRKILVFGADALSKVINFEDRSSCILFGDGAGAVIVEASDENHLFHTLTGSDGSHGKDLYVTAHNARLNDTDVITDNKLHQNGRVVYKWALNTLEKGLNELARRNNIQLHDLDWLIPHSANYRMIEALLATVGVPHSKCLESVRKYGNTSAASIPLAWYEGVKSGRMQPGDKQMLMGFGGGFSYAGIYMIHNIPQLNK